MNMCIFRYKLWGYQHCTYRLCSGSGLGLLAARLRSHMGALHRQVGALRSHVGTLHNQVGCPVAKLMRMWHCSPRDLAMP